MRKTALPLTELRRAMPVQFLCPQCRQLLSVGTRKIGSSVNCPRCGTATIVPEQQAAAADVSAAKAQRPEGGAGMVELVVFDDVPDLLGQNPASPPPAYGAAPSYGAASPYGTGAGYGGSPAYGSTPAYSASPSTWQAPAAGGAGATSPGAGGLPTNIAPRRPGLGLAQDLLLVSRKAVYVQGVLFLVVAAGAFGLGYLIGRGQGSAAADNAQAKKAAQEKVVYSGAISFAAAGGAGQPDAGAVVVLLPAAGQPPRKFSSLGLRPQDAPGKVGDATIAAIQEFGGDFVRTDDAGSFQLVVPTGNYHLLVVSRQGTRKAGQVMAAKDVTEMASYFEVPADLIGNRQHFWGAVSLAGAPPAWTHTFRAEWRGAKRSAAFVRLKPQQPGRARRPDEIANAENARVSRAKAPFHERPRRASSGAIRPVRAKCQTRIALRFHPPSSARHSLNHHVPCPRGTGFQRVTPLIVHRYYLNHPNLQPLISEPQKSASQANAANADF